MILNSGTAKQHIRGSYHELDFETGKPLLARYDLKKAAETLTKDSLQTRRADLWRYEETLPVQHEANILCLGEG